MRRPRSEQRNAPLRATCWYAGLVLRVICILCLALPSGERDPSSSHIPWPTHPPLLYDKAAMASAARTALPGFLSPAAMSLPDNQRRSADRRDPASRCSALLLSATFREGLFHSPDLEHRT